MKLALYNDMDLEIGCIQASTRQEAFILVEADWLPILSDGDKIKVLDLEEEEDQ